MHALTLWRPFILGKHFKVFTDHGSITDLKVSPISISVKYIGWSMLRAMIANIA
jgi:hypothetical protein